MQILRTPTEKINSIDIFQKENYIRECARIEQKGNCFGQLYI